MYFFKHLYLNKLRPLRFDYTLYCIFLTKWFTLHYNIKSMGKHKYPLTATRLPPYLKEQLLKLSEDTGVSQSDLLIHAIEFTLNHAGFTDLASKKDSLYNGETLKKKAII